MGKREKHKTNLEKGKKEERGEIGEIGLTFRHIETERGKERGHIDYRLLLSYIDSYLSLSLSIIYIYIYVIYGIWWIV